MNDPINRPSHYTRSHPGIECIELTADMSFCLGNCCKYVWRYDSKGRPVEDLEKARWYLARLIERGERIALTNDQHVIINTLAVQAAELNEARFWRFLGQSRAELALEYLDELIDERTSA